MEREILFRGKRLDNGEWVEGGLDTDWEIPHEERHRYFISIPYYDAVQVDPATVGQYTGLVDKNGRKIFEGDVVCYDNSPYNHYCTPTTGKIVWRNGSLCFRHCPFGGPHYRSLCSDDFFAVKCEVIGNIHDTETAPCTE